MVLELREQFPNDTSVLGEKRTIEFRSQPSEYGELDRARLRFCRALVARGLLLLILAAEKTIFSLDRKKVTARELLR